MTTKLNPLAVIDRDAEQAANYRDMTDDPPEILDRKWREAEEARAAVAEVVAAGMSYVNARSAYNDAVNSRGLVGQREARLAMEAAKRRHITALSAFEVK